MSVLLLLIKLLTLSSLIPCTTEKADKRVFTDTGDAAEDFRKLLIKTVNSDAIAIARSVIHRIAGTKKL